MINEFDTIAAIATAVSNAGIGIIRISGSEAMEILAKIFEPYNKKADVYQLENHRIYYGNIKDGEEVVDECIVLIMKGPHSYTKEDVVEIDCHGGVTVVYKVLNLVLKNGARAAEPGEFTKRAFLNGRIDLSQAEAVMDLIDSKNEMARKNSMTQLKGGLSDKIKQLREEIIYQIAFIESALDDPEHYSLDGFPEKLLEEDKKWITIAKEMLDSYDNGRIIAEGIRTCIVGKPNAGKSSIINKLLGEERVIVSPVAGTTRDAIDTTVKRNGQEYVFIDTAGLRRKSKIKEELERYSIIRTVTAVERCDVAVLIIDATEGITEQDAKIAGIAHERGKGMIIAVNKWDLVEKDNTTMKKFTEKIREKLSYMPYAELIFLSAKTGQRLPKLFEMIDAVIENCALRVQTGVLNEILTEAMAMKQPPSDKGKRLRIYYITQVSVKPPTFVMFINEKKLTHFSYTRYIENQIRTTFGFRGTPIHFIYRERKEK